MRVLAVVPGTAVCPVDLKRLTVGGSISLFLLFFLQPLLKGAEAIYLLD